jgi:hypothetical protein
MIHSNQSGCFPSAKNASMEVEDKARFAVEEVSRPQAIDRIRRILERLAG